MNEVILSGRLTKDPSLKRTTGGRDVCSFTIATSEEHTQFINCDAWGTTGVNVSKYLRKGSQVFLRGSIQVSKYDANGQTKYVTKVIALSVEFGDRPKEEFEDLPF